MGRTNITSLLNQALAMTDNLAEVCRLASQAEFQRHLLHLQTKLEEGKKAAKQLIDDNEKLKNTGDKAITKKPKDKTKPTLNPKNSKEFCEYELVRSLINQFDYKEDQIKTLFKNSKTLEQLALNIEKLDNFLFNAQRMLKYWRGNPEFLRDLHRAKQSLNQGGFKIS